MIEALLDPKTWLFALLAALNTVPFSTGIQASIIVSSFGFTYLQTTLLASIFGVVEIITIWTGVKLAARLPNSIAYVGACYFVPNILGIFLLNLLPWHNKTGLFISMSLCGMDFLTRSLFGADYDFCRGRHHGLRPFFILGIECDSGTYKEDHNECHLPVRLLYRECRRIFHVASQI